MHRHHSSVRDDVVVACRRSAHALRKVLSPHWIKECTNLTIIPTSMLRGVMQANLDNIIRCVHVRSKHKRQNRHRHTYMHHTKELPHKSLSAIAWRDSKRLYIQKLIYALMGFLLTSLRTIVSYIFARLRLYSNHLCIINFGDWNSSISCPASVSEIPSATKYTICRHSSHMQVHIESEWLCTRIDVDNALHRWALLKYNSGQHPIISCK